MWRRLKMMWVTLGRLASLDALVHCEVLTRWCRGKESACKCRRCKRWCFHPWVGKIPWRRKWQPTPVFMPGKSHGERDPTETGGLQPMASQRVGYDWAQQQWKAHCVVICGCFSRSDIIHSNSQLNVINCLYDFTLYSLTLLIDIYWVLTVSQVWVEITWGNKTDKIPILIAVGWEMPTKRVDIMVPGTVNMLLFVAKGLCW